MGNVIQKALRRFARLLLLSPAIVALESVAEVFTVSTAEEFRAALSTAASNGEEDTITIPAVTIKTTDDSGGTFKYISNEDFGLTIEGADRSSSALDGGQTNGILSFKVVGFDPTITVKNLSINNGQNSDRGGGIYSDEKLEIINCTFLSNVSATDGGAIAIEREKSMQISSSVFQNNQADSGGGVWLGYASNTKISGVTFSSNRSLNNGSGGAIHSQAYSLEIYGSMLDSNSSEVGGGGIYSTSRYSIIEGTTISNNTAMDGSAIKLENISAQIQITNSLIFGNSKGDGVGTLNLWGDYGESILIVNSVIANNGEGLYLGGANETTLIVNSLFANNGDYDIKVEPTTIPSITHSYVQTIEGEVFKSALIESGDLGVVDIQQNDFRLLVNSQLVDAGLTEVLARDWTGASFSLPDTDKDGNQRVVGAAVDIGAFEFATTNPTIKTFEIVGTYKIQSELTFNVVAEAFTGRDLVSWEVDYGDGIFYSTTASHTYTFETAGTRTITIRVTDSEGEWSQTSLQLDVADLSLTEKLSAAETKGKNAVLDDPTSFGLVTTEEKNSAVASAIEAQVSTCVTAPTSCGIDLSIDVDGDGNIDPLTDGLLIIRYLFGFSGDSLISGAVGTNATRTTSTEIEDYIKARVPSS